MKKISLALVFVLLMDVYILLAADNPDCVDATTALTTHIGGRYKTASGNLHILIIFAQFLDDNYQPTNSYWPVDSDPANMNNWVDQTWSSNPTQGSLTHYFNEMSGDRLKVTGECISVTTQHTRNYYIGNSLNRGDIHEEILTDLDATKDFADFDNWDYVSEFNHNDVPDGIIDMIVFVWRNIAADRSNPEQDKVDLNFTHSFGSIGGSDFTLDGGTRTVGTGFGGNESGVTINTYLQADPFRNVIHEFSHYLFGNNDYHNGFGFWGMLSAWGVRSYVANSWERYKLGWMNNTALYTIENSPNQTLVDTTLGDYLDTGTAYRLVIDAANDKYIFIENHQKTNYWENNTPFWHATGLAGNIEKGIYVIRRDGSLSRTDPSWLQCVPADGRHSWEVNQSVANPWGSTPAYLAVFKNIGPNIVNGYHDLEKIPHSFAGVPNPDVIHFTEDASGNPQIDVRHNGDGLDAFRMGYKQVFSPWSNPNNQRENRSTTPFGFFIKSESAGNYTLDIYVGTSVSGPPSKPQNLQVSQVGNSPYVSWNANLEPDVISGGKYNIYRATTTGGEPTSFSLKATVNHPTTNWTDLDLYISGSGTNKVFYKVTAVDSTNKESVKSNYDWLYWDRDLQKFHNTSTDENMEPKYNLFSNYPNPFNPSTQVTFSISQKGHVVLKVYDVLGKEVAELVNETMKEGFYNVTFDGSGLASGMYIVNMQAQSKDGDVFNQSRKILLMK